MLKLVVATGHAILGLMCFKDSTSKYQLLDLLIEHHCVLMTLETMEVDGEQTVSIRHLFGNWHGGRASLTRVLLAVSLDWLVTQLTTQLPR